MGADPLSDVLRTVRLTGATFFNCACRAPWVAESPPEEIILPMVLPGGEHLIAYHVVTEGCCFTNIIGEEPVPIEAGDVIVFISAIRMSCRAAQACAPIPALRGRSTA